MSANEGIGKLDIDFDSILAVNTGFEELLIWLENHPENVVGDVDKANFELVTKKFDFETVVE